MLGQQGVIFRELQALHGLSAGSASPCLHQLMQQGQGGAMQHQLPHALHVPQHARKPRDAVPSEADNV